MAILKIRLLRVARNDTYISDIILDMQQVVQVVQSISALLLIVFVLLQVRGTGFSRSSNSSSFTRRGVEKLVFKLTFVVTALFLLMSAISLFL